MKKTIDLAGNKSLLIHYLKMHSKDNQKKKHNNKHSLKINNLKLIFKLSLPNNYISKHNNLSKTIHKTSHNRRRIKTLKNNNNLLCINNKYNKFFHKLNHYNSYNNN